MKSKYIYIRLTIIAIFPFLCMQFANPQDKLQKSPGGEHGEMEFAINWKRYYSYDEWTGIKIGRAHV